MGRMTQEISYVTKLVMISARVVIHSLISVLLALRIRNLILQLNNV